MNVTELSKKFDYKTKLISIDEFNKVDRTVANNKQKSRLLKR